MTEFVPTGQPVSQERQRPEGIVKNSNVGSNLGRVVSAYILGSIIGITAAVTLTLSVYVFDERGGLAPFFYTPLIGVTCAIFVIILFQRLRFVKQALLATLFLVFFIALPSIVRLIGRIFGVIT